jgi:8-oxo-dGTP pyrophosphatase MutT (NUDIX family)
MDQPVEYLPVEHNLPWLPWPHEARMVLTSCLPPQELISAAFALAFSGERLLMTHLRHRGWDIPGGHVEPGEGSEETVRRELQEETGATLGALSLFGYQHLRLLGPRPEGYRYPYPDSYQVFYWTRIEALEDFLPTAETEGGALFVPAEARQLAWVQRQRKLYEVALALATG